MWVWRKFASSEIYGQNVPGRSDSAFFRYILHIKQKSSRLFTISLAITVCHEFQLYQIRYIWKTCLAAIFPLQYLISTT